MGEGGHVFHTDFGLKIPNSGVLPLPHSLLPRRYISIGNILTSLSIIKLMTDDIHV
jgi:hypothetical protein